MKCTMDKDINICPFVSADKVYCSHPDPICSFVEKPEEPKPEELKEEEPKEQSQVSMEMIILRM